MARRGRHRHDAAAWPWRTQSTRFRLIVVLWEVLALLCALCVSSVLCEVCGLFIAIGFQYPPPPPSLLVACATPPATARLLARSFGSHGWPWPLGIGFSFGFLVWVGVCNWHGVGGVMPYVPEASRQTAACSFRSDTYRTHTSVACWRSILDGVNRSFAVSSLLASDRPSPRGSPSALSSFLSAVLLLVNATLAAGMLGARGASVRFHVPCWLGLSGPPVLAQLQLRRSASGGGARTRPLLCLPRDARRIPTRATRRRDQQHHHSRRIHKPYR